MAIIPFDAQLFGNAANSGRMISEMDREVADRRDIFADRPYRHRAERGQKAKRAASARCFRCSTCTQTHEQTDWNSHDVWQTWK